jgi:hypothetical protein
MRLVYSSQDETKMNRLYRKQDRLEAKLTGKYRVARPKGMHWSTHRRILTDLASVLRKQEHLRAVSARKFLDRHGWPLGYDDYGFRTSTSLQSTRSRGRFTSGQ